MKIDTKEFLKEEIDNGTLKFTEPENLYFSLENSDKLKKDNIYYNEEVLTNTLANDFSNQIKERGKKYYYNGNVESVYKNNNKYIAKVYGASNQLYDVQIIITDEKNADYLCSCPCDFPCKHEYAVIMAIANSDYIEVELKPQIKEKAASLKEIIEKIPAEEIKNYMLSPKGIDHIAIEMGAFSEYFRKYYPKQGYEFYYNNLYNDLVLANNCLEKVDSYIASARQYIFGNEFEESFKIVKSIIEAYHDSNRLNFDDYVFELINKLGMILRITWRKATDDIKEEIKEWIGNLKNKAYYNNYYLEDLIFSLDKFKD